MIKPWCTWFRRRRHHSKPAHRRARFDPWHRRPAFERMEDRWMLSGNADVMLGYDGFIDAAEVLVPEAETGSWQSIRHSSVTGLSGCTTAHVYVLSCSGNDTIRHAQAGPEVQGGGSSTSDPAGAGLPATIADDIEPIRLGPDEPSAPASEEGPIDLTHVLNEPVGLAVFQPAFRQEGMVGVAKPSGRTGVVVAQRGGRNPSASWGNPHAFAVALSWREGASTDFSADGLGPASLRDSPFRPIEGSRGVSQAFELATSGEESLAAPDRASSDQPSPGREPSPDVPPEPSDRTLASVAEPATGAGAGHEALFAELATPLGGALLNAVYLENKRATDLIPLLAVAALTHHLANRPWDGPVNDRIGVAYPRRRHPL